MTKAKVSQIASAKSGDAVRVIDAGTREEITNVISADADAGKVVRFAVEDGNLVREGDKLKIVEEDRAIIIEPVEVDFVSPLEISAIDGEGGEQG